MATAISPNYTLEEFKDQNGNIVIPKEKKIDIFKDRVQGWQINIAKEVDKIPNSGFAVLHIIFSYFETIAKYSEGYIEENKSKEFFEKGFYMVFPDLKQQTDHIQKNALKILYKKARCGLYHGGMTGTGVLISGQATHPIKLKIDGSGCLINPKKLVEVIETHFNSYIEKLKNDENIVMRGNFWRRFNNAS